MSAEAAPLLDTAFVTLRAPWSVGPTFLGLELTVVVCGVLTLLHALGERRRGDGLPLFTWAVSFTYGVAMELLSYNFIKSFAHGQFSVMFYHHQLPLYVVTLYPVFQYPSIVVARRLRRGIGAQILTAGLFIVAMDMPFDILGPTQGWWSWSATDPNTAFRWFDVPVTSYYWHLTWGGLLGGLTAAFGRWGGDVRKAWRIALLALPLSLLTMVLGVLAFLPFHFLKSRGVPDGTIVAGLFVVSLAVALLARRAAEPPRVDARLFLIPALYYAYHLLVALWQLVAGPGPFGKQMVVIAAVSTLSLVAYRVGTTGWLLVPKASPEPVGRA